MGRAMPRTTGRAGGASFSLLGAGAGTVSITRQVCRGGSNSEVTPAATVLRGVVR